MRWMRQIWQRFTGTRLALIEAENKRLRETNFALEDLLEQRDKELRAAINTSLAQAGVAPLPPHEEVKPPVRKMTMRRLTWQQRQRLYAVATMPKPEEKKKEAS